MLRNLIEQVVKRLVEHADKVSVSVEVQDFQTVFLITVDESDRGRLIGKEGKTIKSIRSLASVIAPLEIKSFKIEIVPSAVQATH